MEVKLGEEIVIKHIDKFGNVVQSHKVMPNMEEVHDVFKPGKVTFMNKGKEASPDLLYMGRVLVEINKRQEINPSDIKILKAYGITPGPEIEDIHGFCEKVWDWAKDNL